VVQIFCGLEDAGYVEFTEKYYWALQRLTIIYMYKK